jgi:uncharacterized radical SAM protein YgiQ
VAEAKGLIQQPGFKGRLHDLSGPSANMYGFECKKKLTKGCCPDRRCLVPSICPNMPVDHSEQIQLLRELRSLPGIRQVVLASGIRYDLILADRKNGLRYLREVVRHHISGQMKVAPEHCQEAVLTCMGKPDKENLLHFRDLFQRMTQEEGLPQFLTYYMMAAHPGCRQEDMVALRNFCRQALKHLPKQVQIFTPTPSTWSTVMYWTGTNPFTGQDCFVERQGKGRERQKDVMMEKA